MIASLYRRRCTPLLLALVVAYLALDLHQWSHSPERPGSCELCLGHVDPSQGIPASAVEPGVADSAPPPAAPPHLSVAPARHFHFRQRAPPAPG